MSEKERKEQILNKIAELANMGGVQGLVNGDMEFILVVETIKLVLTAAQDEAHLELLHTHMSNFLDEVQVLTGQKTAKQFLLEKERCVN